MANLVLDGFGSAGWLACPAVLNSVDTYQIFANVSGVQVTGTSVSHCHGIVIALEPLATGGREAAYQYD